MKCIYKAAIDSLNLRIRACNDASRHPNTMVSLGWSDARYKAVWMGKACAAICKRERIIQRINKMGGLV